MEINPLGIFSWFGYSLPLKQRLKLIKQAGFTTTCLWFGNEEQMFHDGLADQMADLARDQGLVIDNVHAPYEHVNLLWSESSKENETVRIELTNSLLYCSKHKIPVAVLHITEGYHPPPITKNGLKIIQDLVGQAESLGITIAIENTRRPDYIDTIFSNIQSNNLGFCYDSSHDFLPGQSKGNILKRWSSLLLTTHLSDNKGINDDHLLPGDGTIDWNIIGKFFPKNNYSGALILEVDAKPDARLTPEGFLRIAYERLLQIKSILT